MNQQEIGLHLILVPATEMISSPIVNAIACQYDRDATLVRMINSANADLYKDLEDVAEQYNSVLAAEYAKEDHWHLLFKCNANTNIADLIQRIMHVTKQHQFALGNNDFLWSDEVHVTLLPPWHVEIMASFVRDQDRFHQRFTFEEELDIVFRPNAPLPEDKNQLLSAHIH